MSKKKKETIKKVIVGRIEEANIFDYNKAFMMIFFANVNLARAIPDIRDGLKPVERRVLYSMYEDEGMRPGQKTKKCAKVIGACLGNYYPHGDSSVYDVLIRLGQWWTLYPTLVKKQGNYGNIFGSSAAAMRYTECGMSEFAYDAYFSEWSKNCTDFVPSYTKEKMEPEYFPSKYPVLLIKGTFGIGKGLMSGIPPHNINELMDLCIKLLDNPKYKNCVLYPDFPSECDIVDTDFKTICDKGEGSFRIRGRVDIEDDTLIIKSIPYRTNTEDIIKEIVDLVRGTDKKKPDPELIGLADLIDHSEILKGDDSEDDEVIIDIRLPIRKGFNPEEIRDVLYRKTHLEDTFSVNYEATFEYANYHYSLRSMILDWIEIDRENKRRNYAHEYSKVSKRLHLLESILGAIDKYGDEQLISIMRKSRNKRDAVDKMIKKFGLTDIQAEAIVDMSLYRFSQDDIKNYRIESVALRERLEVLDAKLLDDDCIDNEIRKDLLDCKQKYGRPRLCQVITVDKEKNIPDTNHTIIITKKGFIKKHDLDTDGVGYLDTNDKAIQIIKLNNREELLIFDESGKVFSLPVNEISPTAIEGSGMLLNNYINTSNKIVTIMTKPSEKDLDNMYLVFATKNGIVKKSLFKNYMSVTKNGLIGLILKKDDELKAVIQMKGNRDVILYTRNGKGNRYSAKDIPETLRTSSGVIGMKLEGDDNVLGMSTLKRGDKYLFMITNKGNAKKCLLYNFDNMKRSDKGLNLIDLAEGEKLVGIKPVKDEDVVDIFTTEKIVSLDMSGVPELTRKSKAKKLVGVRKGENIIDIY